MQSRRHITAVHRVEDQLHSTRGLNTDDMQQDASIFRRLGSGPDAKQSDACGDVFEVEVRGGGWGARLEFCLHQYW